MGNGVRLDPSAKTCPSQKENGPLDPSVRRTLNSLNYLELYIGILQSCSTLRRATGGVAAPVVSFTADAAPAATVARAATAAAIAMTAAAALIAVKDTTAAGTSTAL